jgi:hypothetical protein
MGTVRVAKNVGNYEQMVESYIRASSAATFGVNKKERLVFSNALEPSKNCKTAK